MAVFFVLKAVVFPVFLWKILNFCTYMPVVFDQIGICDAKKFLQENYDREKVFKKKPKKVGLKTQLLEFETPVLHHCQSNHGSCFLLQVFDFFSEICCQNFFQFSVFLGKICQKGETSCIPSFHMC